MGLLLAAELIGRETFLLRLFLELVLVEFDLLTQQSFILLVLRLV